MRVDTQTPHIEPEWSEAFLLELRLRGVDGRRIGAALAEVEAHCAESGGTAAEAFGDPAAYAAALAPNDAPVLAPGRELITSSLGLAGLLLTPPGVAAWRAGERVEVTAGLAFVIAITALTSAAIVWQAERVLRLVVRAWWIAALTILCLILLTVVALAVGREPLFWLPAPVTVLLGCLLLAVSTALTLRQGAVSDPVVGPEGAGGAGTMTNVRLVGALERLTPWLLPIFTALMVLAVLIFG